MSATDWEQQYLLGVFSRFPVTFVAGEGARLLDDHGREYLDFFAGIAVCSVGHSRPEVADAVADQMRRLVHVSNWYYTQPQLHLARQLHQLAGWGRVFFGNSGAEANECAVKLARRWAQDTGGPGKFEIVSLLDAFHGRTLATLAATGQPAKQARFGPLPPGFLQIARNDIAALEAAVSAERTAAVLVEVVQGEGGVWPLDDGFMVAARDRCDEAGAVLIVDEIQTGLCRTGRWLGFQTTPVEPDIYTLGKAIANGLPLSACVAREPVASAFQPGDHGSTMSGGAVMCAAALTVLSIMRDENLALRAQAAGERLAQGLYALHGVREVRGRGLLLAAELDGINSRDVAESLLAAGLVCNPVTPTALRFAPPLVVSNEEIDEGLHILGKVLG